MNYEKHYNRLIFRAKNRLPPDFYETHHIVPRCIGGSNDVSNLIKLTPEEHYTAHLLLIKIYKDPKLVYAARMMTIESKNNRRGNKIYGWLRRRFINVCKQRTGKRNGSFGKRWYTNPLTMESRKFSDNSVPSGWIKGRRIKSELKSRDSTNCICCGEKTNSHKAKWCNSCRPTAPARQQKSATYFTDEEKIAALRLHNGKIRHALFHLGLNDSGSHYKHMRDLKASLYPLATNQ